MKWQHKEHDIQSCTAVFRRTHASQHEPRQTRRKHTPRSIPKTLSWLAFLDNNVQRTTIIYVIHLKKLRQVTNNPHYHHTTHHNRFTALFAGQPEWAGARTELLDFMVQGKINRGRHTGHPAGRHSIQTNQCPPAPSPIFYRPDALPATQPTVSKH